MQLIELPHFSEQEPLVLDNWTSYWQTGVDLALKGDITEAQSTWLLPFLEIDSATDEATITDSLAKYLDQAADQQNNAGNLENAINLRQFLQELLPHDINNLLKLVYLSIHNCSFEIDLLSDCSVILFLQEAEQESIIQEALDRGIKAILEFFQPSDIEIIADLIAVCLQKSPRLITTLSVIANEAFVLAYKQSRPDCSIRILEACLNNSPKNLHLSIQCSLSDSAAKAGQVSKAIQVAQECYESSLYLSTEEQVRASHMRLSVFMDTGDWLKIPATAQEHLLLLQRFIAESPNKLLAGGTIVNSSYFLNYLYDEPQKLHFLRNEIGKIYTKNLQVVLEVENNNPEAMPKKIGVLRIGYIASSLRKHSVGWLSRWLFTHHDRQNLEIFLYHVNQQDNDPFNHTFFRDKAHFSSYCDTNVDQIVNQIKQDQIDILVDLDSLSFSTTYEVMCHKPAPVQVTWLGWDASGCPAIDYYIADPYVLPANASEYYSAQIWRLPHTYLAIDGFESDVPSRKRADYDLPEDAIVYLCNQKSYKHHPDILRLQLQIIKSVPNSYLLIKLRTRGDGLIESYQALLDEVGIDMKQLRFLIRDDHEYSHRANLTIADVVLDTFPYNGATTTLETLWMNVPMVTKVGEAFVARNSYTFMKNAGLTEGIAWTDEEYVEWGIRLGTDRKLRQQVRGKLLTSRKTSPLWNAQQFTKDMESAYQSMWQKYLEQQN
jgi:predicted O-linked N-acetylglucosamine transferase (SPINDLY family)